MVVKVFVLGRSGSGKSTSIRFLTGIAERQGWAVKHFNEYNILKHRLIEDVKHQRIRPTSFGGFEVLDLSLYTETLKTLEQEIQDFCPPKEETLITIEFASNNYNKSLGSFNCNFLQDAEFLFLLADLDICLQRIHDRCAHPNYEDDFFVPDIVPLSHYTSPHMPYKIMSKKTTFIDNLENNSDSLSKLESQLEEFMKGMLNSSRIKEKISNQLSIQPLLKHTREKYTVIHSSS